MNKAEMAIKKLKKQNRYNEIEKEVCEGESKKIFVERVKYLKNDIEINNLAIQALESQIPKKPKEWEGHESCCVCPSCGENISKRPFCSLCGQRLELGDTKNEK